MQIGSYFLTVSELTSIEEQRAFIQATNEGLKMNVDAFGAAMGAFLASEHD